MMNKIDLVTAPTDVELEVLEITSGEGLKKRLISMGVHPGDKIIKFNHASWGPILVKNSSMNSSKIAIGRRVAYKIWVKPAS